MRLNGEELERTAFHSKLKVSEEITRLTKKFEKEIALSRGGNPEFTIEDVPSVMNGFKRLEER